MKVIKKSYLSLIWRAIWGLILIEIPFFVRWFEILGHSYQYDNNNLYVEEGIFNKNSTTIPLYKIDNVSSEANIFGNGTVVVSCNIAGAKHTAMYYVANAKAAAAELRNASEAARKARGIKEVDTF